VALSFHFHLCSLRDVCLKGMARVYTSIYLFLIFLFFCLFFVVFLLRLGVLRDIQCSS
jgi:hypothetical protein